MEFDEEKFSIDFGRHLQDIREGKKIRIGKKISLRKLDQLSGIDHSHIHKIEKGTSSPSLLTLKTLALALEISMADLVRFED
ncbi:MULTISPECIES: helix-turn-helix domain-containing protein [unclassified Sphingobacterium]|uniref:helix-turn-helix domain-containing protein n=1 Tax=unclassified Sphingobacterium TaxID=2609468 RepID=UPI0010533B71|nr:MULTISPECIES: helix-turn-helix transcriptional regulator [unclassified Sphingobacterium]MCS3553155.1 transcriptional regulator with XRE-family HTH domain [Sphingobacterium sp. JUb21]QQD15823.1 helix-turn-helix transcriptional regulator [Sphingobacterium sp. UDSM-2020]TCR09635.1 helix-turn-helix protein [Sphingobacterium sp. JUb20]